MDTNDRSKDATENNLHGVDIHHAIDIVKAAFPYLDSESQQSINLFIKVGELLETINDYHHSSTVTTFSIRKQSIDLESLLVSIRDVCYDTERKLIDMFLNMFRVRDLYNTYTTYASLMASQASNGDNPNGESNTTGNTDMMGVLESLLSPEQRETFDLLRNIM